MAEETKEKKCPCVLVLGIIILALGLFADVLGLGQSTMFGPKQIIAVILGIALILYGRKGSKFCKCGKKEG